MCSESEVSGSSALVSPVQSRRRPTHGLPRQHPHSRVRKVSAPPELQPHLGGGTSPHHNQAHAHNNQGAGGTNPDHADRSSNPGYILSLPSQTHREYSFLSCLIVFSMCGSRCIVTSFVRGQERPHTVFFSSQCLEASTAARTLGCRPSTRLTAAMWRK